MKSNLRIGLLGAVLAALVPGLAQAQRANLLYVSADAGISVLQDLGVERSDDVSLRFGDVGFDPGLRIDVGVGYLLRGGGVASYNHSAAAFDVVVGLDAGMLCHSGKVEESTGPFSGNTELTLYQFPVMANVAFRFPVFTERLNFSVGGGLGVVTALVDAEMPGGNARETDILFGYQGTAGLSYDLSERMVLGISYQFLGTSKGSYGGALNVDTDELMSHTLAVTAKWVF